MERSREIIVQISSGTIVRVFLWALLAVFLFLLRDLVLIVLTAIVIASAIEPAVRWLGRYRIPRIASVLTVYLGIISFLLAIFYFFMPPLLSDLAAFLSTLPQYLDTVEASNPLTNNPLFPFLSTTVGDTFSLSGLVSSIEQSLRNVSEGLLKVASTVFGGLFSFIMIVVFSFYFAMQETGIDDFLRIITPLRHQKQVLGLWRRSQQK